MGVAKDEPKKRQRMPTKDPKSGHFKEWAAKRALFCDILGMDENQLVESNIESIRCKGRDHKEARMVRRIWSIPRVNDWGEEEEGGYYILFSSVTSFTEQLIAKVGPFEEEIDSIRAYNTIIKHYGFSKSLLIDDPDDIEEDEDEWGERIVRPSDDMDWNGNSDDDDDDPWGENEEPDEDEWGEDTDPEDEDDGWT